MHDARPDRRLGKNGSLPARLARLFAALLLLLAAAALAVHLWKPYPLTFAGALPAPPPPDAAALATVSAVDQAFAAAWQESGLTPAPPAPDLTVLRRLGLALTGTIPSLEEVRAVEALAPSQRLDAWLAYLFADQRHADYLAERFARVFAGADNGPFLVFRRRRLKSWLADQIAANTPYDQTARALLTAEGLFTSNPATNFITYTVDQANPDKKKGPDEIRLASRTARAFLGIRLDCVQCHDDKLHDTWKQTDFHQLAAFYGGTSLAATGVRDQADAQYSYRLHGASGEEEIQPSVPFQPSLMPSEGTLRQRLAAWITHPENRAFARATVNRAWAQLFGKPLVEPIDDIPVAGPWPPALEILSTDFAAHGYDLRRLYRLIAQTRVFQLDSRSADPDQPLTEAHEIAWAAFPLSPLRPEQVAQSLVQASSLKTVNATSHIAQRLRHFGQTKEFIERYGDPGENEFDARSSTISQRLLLMNGKSVRELAGENPILNASSRIALLASGTSSAVRSAYLAILTRLPTEAELAHFTSALEKAKSSQSRQRAMADLYWSLVNSTEFAWNH